MGKLKFAALFFAAIAGLYSFRPVALSEFHVSGFAQGTTYHITYYAADSVLTHAAANSIFGSLDSSLSIYKPYSLISKYNKAKRGIKADHHLRTVVKRGLRISEDSKGIFDMTVMPLVKAWGFGPDGKSKNLPDAATIKNILKYVGYRKVSVKGDSLLKAHPNVTIDVNGIAQGYSVDVIADYLTRRGIQNFLVEVGGEVRVKGRKQPSGQTMKIGIESPSTDDLEGVLIKKVALKDGALTTSGKYRQFYQSGNKKISHLIDPRTGYTLSNEMVSTTVWAKDGITADGYDNVLMGMTVKKAFDFLKKHRFLEAYFIYTDGGVVKDTATAGFKAMFTE